MSKVIFEDHDCEVGRTSEVVMFCFFDLLYQAIPLLLDMKDDLKEMKGDLKEMKGDVKEMKGDLNIVQKNTDVISRIHEDIKGIREGIQPGLCSQF